MSDGQRSGSSTGKSTELKRCSMIEMRWHKYEVSLASPVWTQIRRPSSELLLLLLFYFLKPTSTKPQAEKPVIIIVINWQARRPPGVCYNMLLLRSVCMR